MIRQFSLLCAVLLLGACASLKPTPVDSGLSGQVSIGPLCPVVQVGVDCPDKPYQASFTVLTTDRKEITHFRSDANGIFEIALPPGDYILRPESPNSLPFAPEQLFSVVAGQFTRLIVIYDSGIR